MQSPEAVECYNFKHILALEIINKTRKMHYLCKFKYFLKEAHKSCGQSDTISQPNHRTTKIIEQQRIVFSFFPLQISLSSPHLYHLRCKAIMPPTSYGMSFLPSCANTTLRDTFGTSTQGKSGGKSQLLPSPISPVVSQLLEVFHLS